MSAERTVPMPLTFAQCRPAFLLWLNRSRRRNYLAMRSCHALKCEQNYCKVDFLLKFEECVLKVSHDLTGGWEEPN